MDIGEDIPAIAMVDTTGGDGGIAPITGLIIDLPIIDLHTDMVVTAGTTAGLGDSAMDTITKDTITHAENAWEWSAGNMSPYSRPSIRMWLLSAYDADESYIDLRKDVRLKG